MKRQLFFRGLLGFPLGIAIGHVVSIVVSAMVSHSMGHASYFVCAPALIDLTGNELNAVILQTLLSGVLGSVFAASSMIWELEDWSIAKQTGMHFTITASVMMPIAYLLKWMDNSFYGFVVYFAIFALIFFVIWLVQYWVVKKKIDQINAKLK
ncbi:MAG: DUF3021 domain-containing protein [Eubacteriaceae bacterium]|jgi:hypothetical protein|nr:DUF3021 domain-containing protein [Eubacteriaceae bacterium]